MSHTYFGGSGMLLEVMAEELIGVLEADFVEPIHDKQAFERTTVLQRLENAKEILVCFLHLFSSNIYVLCLNYIVYQQLTFSRSMNCQHIVYAKRSSLLQMQNPNLQW